MIDFCQIDDIANELYDEFVRDGIITESNRGLVCVPEQIIRRMFKQFVTDRYYRQLSEASSDKDAMADLQILLWEIKKEKEK